MQDVAIRLGNHPGALANMGETLGRSGVSIEGGGGFVVGETGIVHFLFEDGGAVRRVLEGAGTGRAHIKSSRGAAGAGFC